MLLSVTSIDASLFVELPSATQFAQLADQGFLYIVNLPQDFNRSAYVSQLGPVMRHDSGQSVYSVKADSQFCNLSYSNSRNAIPPHTEAPYRDPPPRYLALWAVQPSSCGGGLTTFCDGYGFVAGLEESRQRKLSEEVVSFPPIVEENRARHPGIEAPIFQRRPSGAAIFRFSYNLFSCGYYNPPAARQPEGVRINDPWLAELADSLLDYFRHNCYSVRLDADSLVVLDNHRMLHGRTAFTDAGRHLKALWLE